MRRTVVEGLGRAAPPTDTALADPENAWQDEVDGLPVAFPKDGYQGDYIADIAQELVDSRGQDLVDEPGDGRVWAWTPASSAATEIT